MDEVINLHWQREVRRIRGGSTRPAIPRVWGGKPRVLRFSFILAIASTMLGEGFKGNNMVRPPV